MNDKQFLKRIAEFGDGTRLKIEKFFGGAINSGKEMVEKFKAMSAKTRVKLIKQVGAGLLSVLVLAGFTGCVNDKGEIDETRTSAQVTLLTPEDLNGATSSAFASGTRPVVPESSAPESRPIVPTTTAPETTPVVPGTAAPETTTPVAPSTSTPETTPVVPETTAPEATPSVPAEDLPADADGYNYPKFFRDLVHERVVGQRLLSDTIYYDEICKAEPEIVFVERGPMTNTSIAIYVRYNIDNENMYVRFEFAIKSRAYANLGTVSKYTSYAGYVDAIKTALEERCNNISAQITELRYKTDEINDGLNSTFAKFVDDRFVDAEINFVRVVDGEDGWSEFEISGFGYDGEGKSYSFKANIDPDVPYNSENLIADICASKLLKSDLESFNSTAKAIDSVFTRESQNEQ